MPAEPGTPIHMTFKDVKWVMDPTNNVLNLHLVMHLWTGDMYLRTVEEHSTICGGTSAIQVRVIASSGSTEILCMSGRRAGSLTRSER